VEYKFTYLELRQLYKTQWWDASSDCCQNLKYGFSAFFCFCTFVVKVA